MKLVAWNSAWNTFKMPHERVEEIIAVTKTDVAVISETCRPFADVPGRIWQGDHNPGLSIFVRGDYQIEPVEPVACVSRYSIPVRIRGPVSFLLLAVWPVKETYEGVAAYHRILM